MNLFFIRRLPLFSVLLALALPSLAHAATLNVPSATYPTIQSGVDAAANGDTVLVADGTYSGPGNRDIDFHGKSLTVTSQNGPTKTIISCGGYKSADGSGNHRGFYIHSGEKNATISGFTVKNGYETYFSSIPDSAYGGGIYNGSYGSGMITLTNCTITANTAYTGGGVFSGNYGSVYNTDSGTITLTNCTITANTAYIGGGGVYNDNDYTDSGTITLTNCAITANTVNPAYGGGGGVYNSNSGTITLTNCTITANTTYDGSILNVNYSGTITLTNDIIYGDAGGEIPNNSYSTSSVIVTYSDVQGGSPGVGNINKDPLFVNAAAGDLHLKPGSPCLGAGTPTGAPPTDLDGNPRPNPPSIGAYELAAPPAYTAKITAIYMDSSHELEVDVSTDSVQSIQRLVTLDMTINGQPVHVSENVYFDNPLDNPHYFIIDLKQAGVPRFKDNQRFTVTESVQENGSNIIADRKDGVILLPVVIVPGIGPLSGTIIGEQMNDDHPAGGPGTFPGFEDYLYKSSQSLVDSIGLGKGYESGTILPTNYQTLYTLTYVRNIASFSDGATALSNQIKNIIATSSVETYADRVNIITHSKGGLVTRQYLADLGNNASSTVKQLILTVPPNLGSPLAVAGRVINHNYDYRNLTPTYPWFRPIQGLSRYYKLPPNPELDSLNRQRLPSGIDYTLVYSRAFHYKFGYTTPETYTATTLGLFSSHFTFDEGDGVVPWFSQLGLQYDPNNPNKTPALIPAFVDSSGQPIITDEKEVTSFHSDLLDNSDAQSYIFDKLTGDIK